LEEFHLANPPAGECVAQGVRLGLVAERAEDGADLLAMLAAMVQYHCNTMPARIGTVPSFGRSEGSLFILLAKKTCQSAANRAAGPLAAYEEAIRLRSSGSRIAAASSLLAPRNVLNRANPRASASANA
jgi:hypothetical protein